MKAEHIDKIIDVIRLLGLACIGAFTVIKGIREIMSERSTGRSALIKLGEEHAAIKREVEELKKEHVDLSDEVQSIQSKYEKLIEKMLNNFPFKQ